MTISNWILSIAGVVVLSVLVDLFLPDGKTNGIIKMVFNFAIILVVVTPLPNLLNKDYDANKMFPSQSIILQEEYIYQLNRDKLTMLENQIEDAICDKGIQGVNISISADIFVINMKIDKVFVDLSQIVIQEDLKNINIQNEVVMCVKCFVDIEKENIIFG